LPRTIIYERRIPARQQRSPGSPAYGSATKAGADETKVRPGDDFATRLTKYLPAETIALVALVSSISGITRYQIWAIVLVGAIGQVLVLRQASRKLDKPDQPSWRQLVFAVVAYAGWVLGTTPAFCDSIHVDRTTGTIVMACVAYLLPLVDVEAHDLLDNKDDVEVLTR
jgi:hypothetical protein